MAEWVQLTNLASCTALASGVLKGESGRASFNETRTNRLSL
jgi:hypothetical protein